MRILIITATFPPEPLVTSQLSHDIATELTVNNEVTVLCPKPTRPFGSDYIGTDLQKSRLPFRRIQLSSFTSPQFSLIGRFRESYSIGKHCSRYIKKNHLNFDVVYINTWPLFGQYFALRAAKKFNLPVVMHIQDIYPESLLGKLPIFKKIVFKLLLPFDRHILQNVSKIVTISPNMRSLLIKTRKLDKEKVEVVYNWQNENMFIDYRKTKTNIPKNPLFTFMFLGSLNVTAAVHILINAFNKAGLKNARLVIAGSGPEKENLISLAKTYPEANIEFWDAQIQRVPEIQDQADVLLLNLSKGAAQFALPSKVPAYLFSQKPVIASVDEDSDTTKLITSANCGWTVPPEDNELLAKAMQDAASTSSDKLNYYGNNGLKYAFENLSRKANLHKIVSIIEIIALNQFNSSI